MSVLPYLIIVILVGLAVARLAPLLLGGQGPVGFERTAIVGVGAAFIAGLFCWYVLDRHGWGIFASVLFSSLVVWFYRRLRPLEYRASRPAQNRGSRPAQNRGSRPAPYGASRPVDYGGSRSAQYRGRTQGGRRPPY